MTPHDQALQGTAAQHGRKAGWAASLAVAVLICLTPAILWKDALRSPFLKLDDFVYLAQSRTRSRLIENLMTPHNAHVVPLFAIQNHVLARLAGSLEAVPKVWAIACYLELVLAMLVTGGLVATETGRVSLGLAAMAGVGTSTVLGPAVLWYSAGQALVSGTMILVMLLAFCLWRVRGGWLFLVLAALAAAAAPLYWSAGYVAGLVALAFLLGDRRVSRPLALVPLGISILTGVFVWSLAGTGAAPPGQVDESASKVLSRVPIGLAHTIQAIPEVLLLNNLGLNAATTLPQAFALCLLLTVWWKNSRAAPVSAPACDRGSWRGFPRPGPLEAAGATLVVTCFVMIYSARGYQSFENLRALGWYHAIPHLGAVLFVSGWVAGRLPRSPTGTAEPATLRELLCVLLFVAGLLMLQSPRANRVLYEYDGMAARIETREGPRSESPRSPTDLVLRSDQQRAALARLDRMERVCQRREIGCNALRLELGREMIPGMPTNLPDLDAFNLLDIPDGDTGDARQPRGDAIRELKAEGSF